MFLRIITLFSFMLWTAHCELMQHPEDTEAVVGQEQVVLKCRTDITDIANPVEWHHKVNKDAAFEIVYKRGMILNGYRGRLRVFPNATTGQFDLVITGVKLEDAGAYTCMDRDRQHKAELIVFEKYPSDAFCMSNMPSDGLLGSNDCRLESDTVRMSCDLSYRGNLAPVLEWMGGETVITPNITNEANGVTKSSVQQKADQLQTSTYTCRIKYLDSTIVSNLTWSTTVNITSFKNATNLSQVGCDHESINCSNEHNRECSYIWLSENGTDLASSSTMKLTDKPDGNYICLATCNIRQTSCSYVAKTFNYQCNQYNSHQTVTNVSPKMHALTIYITVGTLLVGVAVIMIILAVVFRRLLCTCKDRRCLCGSNDSEAEEGRHSYPKDVPHTESCLSLTKNEETKQTNMLNNGTISSKEMPEKNNLLRQS